MCFSGWGSQADSYRVFAVRLPALPLPQFLQCAGMALCRDLFYQFVIFQSFINQRLKFQSFV